MPHPPQVERWSRFKVWLFSLGSSRTPHNNLAAVDRVAPGPGDRLLDVGCGLGAALERAASMGAEVAGIDPSPPMVDRARRRVPTATIEVGSAEDIPFPDGAFTVVLAVATYHHWADRAAGLAEIRRVLAPGGRFLLVEQKLKRGEGHGLDPADAEELASQLLRMGFASASVDDIPAGRKTQVAISARGPA